MSAGLFQEWCIQYSAINNFSYRVGAEWYGAVSIMHALCTVSVIGNQLAMRYRPYFGSLYEASTEKWKDLRMFGTENRRRVSLSVHLLSIQTFPLFLSVSIANILQITCFVFLFAFGIQTLNRLFPRQIVGSVSLESSSLYCSLVFRVTLN